MWEFCQIKHRIFCCQCHCILYTELGQVLHVNTYRDAFTLHIDCLDSCVQPSENKTHAEPHDNSKSSLMQHFIYTKLKQNKIFFSCLPSEKFGFLIFPNSADHFLWILLIFSSVFFHNKNNESLSSVKQSTKIFRIQFRLLVSSLMDLFWILDLRAGFREEIMDSHFLSFCVL